MITLFQALVALENAEVNLRTASSVLSRIAPEYRARASDGFMGAAESLFAAQLALRGSLIHSFDDLGIDAREVIPMPQRVSLSSSGRASGRTAGLGALPALAAIPVVAWAAIVIGAVIAIGILAYVFLQTTEALVDIAQTVIAAHVESQAFLGTLQARVSIIDRCVAAQVPDATCAGYLSSLPAVDPTRVADVVQQQQDRKKAKTNTIALAAVGVVGILTAGGLFYATRGSK